MRLFLKYPQLILFFITFIFCVSATGISAQSAQDVSLYMQPASLRISPGDSIALPIKLSTNTTAINAVQADITYPADLFEVESITATESAFNLEVLSSAKDGNISIVRGSFTPVIGNNLAVATINFKAVSSGIAALDFAPSSVVVNSSQNSLTSSPGITLIILPSATPPPVPSATLAPTPLPSSTPIPTLIPEPAIIPTPTPAPKSLIKIYAAGSSVKNIYPTIKLDVKDPVSKIWKSVKTFTNVKGDLNSRLFQELTYTHTTGVLAENIRIRFINDSYAPKINQDRNVLIDRINIDGVDIQTERVSTYSTGTWNDSGCKAGNKKSEWLHCNGFIEYR